MINVLVTGGAGFIGSHLVKHHLDKGDHVWVIDNLSSVDKRNIEPFFSNPNMRFDEEDICTGPIINEAVAWSDRIYHLAAVVGMQQVLKVPADTLSSNMGSLEKVLKAMTKTEKKPHLVIASSSGVYWHNALGKDERYKEDATLQVPSGSFLQEAYCLSKLTGEVMTLAYAHQYKLRCTIARFFNTVGTNQTGMYGMVVPSFIRQALSGKPITVYGDGTQTRSFCNVHDVVEGLDHLLDYEESIGQIYNIGNDEECPILTLAKKVKEKTNSSSEIKFVSHKEAYGVDFVEVTRRRPNTDKVHALTGFKPKWSLDQTLDEIIEDIRGKMECEKDQEVVKQALNTSAIHGKKPVSSA